MEQEKDRPSNIESRREWFEGGSKVLQVAAFIGGIYVLQDRVGRIDQRLESFEHEFRKVSEQIVRLEPVLEQMRSMDARVRELEKRLWGLREESK